MCDNRCLFNVIDWQSLDFNVVTYKKNSDGETIVEREKKYLIRAFGRNLNGKSFCLNIYEYKPIFYLKFINENSTFYIIDKIYSISY